MISKQENKKIGDLREISPSIFINAASQDLRSFFANYLRRRQLEFLLNGDKLQEKKK